MRIHICDDSGTLLDSVEIDETEDRLIRECETPRNIDTLDGMARHAASDAIETIVSELCFIVSLFPRLRSCSCTTSVAVPSVGRVVVGAPNTWDNLRTEMSPYNREQRNWRIA